MTHRDVWETIARTRAVEPADVNGAWVPYVERFFEHRKWPCYFLSSADMKADKRFRWVVYEDCLLVFRSIANFGFHINLAFPPLSVSGDLQREVELFRWLGAAGVGVRISEEDLAVYGESPSDYTVLKERREFIYRAGDYHELKGKPWAHWRNVANNAERSGWTMKSWPWSTLPFEVVERMVAISEQWGVERDKPPERAIALVRGFTPDTSLSFFDEPEGDGWVTMSYDKEGVARAWVAFQQLYEDRAVLLMKHWIDGEYPSRDAARFLHLETARWVCRHKSPETLYNMGWARSRKLAEGKRTLRPHHELPIFKAPLKRSITKEDWERARAFKGSRG